jgi:hypothetical protein
MMKNWRNVGLVALLLLSAFAIAVAQDFGFSADTQSVTTMQGGSPDVTLLNRDYAWMKAENDNLSFSAQGSYRITFNNLYFFDIDHLYLLAKFPSIGAESTLLTVKAGRFEVADFSKYVLDHPLDGLRLEYSNAMTTIGAYVGYSGSLWDNLLTTISMSRADNIDKNSDTLHLQPPRLIGMLDFGFPQVISGLSIDVDLLFQQDLRNSQNFVQENTTAYDGTRGGSLSTQYAGVGLHAAPTSYFFFDLFSYFGTGNTLSYIDGVYQYKPIYSALAGGSIRFYLEKALYSMIELNGVYSTGDSDYTTYYEGNTQGYANIFMPISHLPVGVAFDPDLGNIFFASLDYSFLPFAGTKLTLLQKLQTMVKGIAFFRSTPSVISLSGLNPGSTSLYLGTEADAMVNWRPSSDVGFSLAFGCFFPDKSSASSAFISAQSDMTLVLKADLSISL